MGKRCDLCKRRATKGASRSHSKIKTLKRQNINLQSKVINGVKLKVCTSCLRSMNKPTRVKTKRKPALKTTEDKRPKTKIKNTSAKSNLLKKAASKKTSKK